MAKAIHRDLVEENNAFSVANVTYRDVPDITAVDNHMSYANGF